ncbi:hypothetical protein [Pseudogemmobacter bohemicus]|uniref:hypothetical protein n=1 Tax=Pseudogemmobacter bohemicus TaxID=2250708 RepID=UPI001300882A|nr:hypothetical protein [Pseudogemmobacter bohemicus]
MDRALVQSCLVQVSIWRGLLESGEVSNSFINNAEYKSALLSLSESLEGALEGCKDGDEKESPFMHLIIRGDVSSARNGILDLKDWLKGANKITICDPYFLHFKPSQLFKTIEEYADGLAEILPASARHIDIFSNSYSSPVRKCVMGKLKGGRNIRHFSSDKLHDRFIIKDGTEGRVIGTSFGGFGSKFFAMMDLPDYDVISVMSELRDLCLRPVGSRS